MYFVMLLVFGVFINNVFSVAGKDFNVVNNDGSFSFGLSNDDIGAHYHSASGSANTLIRGRYGARSPDTGRIEETVYTAGPRGFRARGPKIHRKMNLSQIPRGPIGTKDDPLADPYDDPSYGFGFRTSTYQRREDGDSNGRVRGLYSYLDDVNERHTVRYAAGSGTGFEVVNAVPDDPAYVRYNAPLYKANRNTRGRIAFERGPGRQYKFIASGPDQRRSESTGADGITRGSYSYLDDKGMQRTVEYIAGAGIGYKVIKSTIGPGTHLLPRPAIPEFRTTQQSNDIIDDDGGTGFRTAESGRPYPNQINRDGFTAAGTNNHGFNVKGNNNRNNNNPYENNIDDDNNNNNVNNNNNNNNNNNDNINYNNNDNNDDNDENIYDNNRDGDSFINIGHKTSTTINNTNYSNKNNINSSKGNFFNRGNVIDSSANKYNNANKNNDYNLDKSLLDIRNENNKQTTTTTTNSLQRRPAPTNNNNFNRGTSKFSFNADRDFDRDININDDDDDDDNDDDDNYDYVNENSPFIASNNKFGDVDNERQRNWNNENNGHRTDSTIVKNIGESYVTLPPGTSVRAHVQNIDLLPLTGRTITPAEALRRDEEKSNRPY